MKRMKTTLLVSACLALLMAGGGGAALAGSDPPPPQHPPLADCQAVWDDGSARNSCWNEHISTHPGKCRVEAWCRAEPRYPWAGHSEASVPRDGCLFAGEEGIGSGRHFKFHCLTEVKFSPDNTDSVTNCDGQLRRGSSC